MKERTNLLKLLHASQQPSGLFKKLFSWKLSHTPPEASITGGDNPGRRNTKLCLKGNSLHAGPIDSDPSKQKSIGTCIVTLSEYIEIYWSRG